MSFLCARTQARSGYIATAVRTLGSAAFLASLGGCSKAPENTGSLPAAGAYPPSLTIAGDSGEATKAVNDTLPRGDPARPLANYRKIDSGYQVMFLYFAMLKLPLQYEDIAQVYSAEYSQTTDSFRRKDIIKAMQPRIDQEVELARTSRYVMSELDGGNLLDRYNFEKKSFGVKGMSSSYGYNYFTDNPLYKLGQTNATQFLNLPVQDEAKARVIEGYLAKFAPLRMEVYSFAQDADPSQRAVKLEVMKIRLYSPTNELLAEM